MWKHKNIALLRKAFRKWDTYFMGTKEPRVQVTLEAHEHAQVMLIATKFKLTRSKAMAKIIREWLEERKQEQERDGD